MSEQQQHPQQRTSQQRQPPPPEQPQPQHTQKQYAQPHVPQWTGYMGGGVANRSEHAVSNPIGIGPRINQYGAMVSPRSISEQSGIFHQMVENVLASSPGSARSDLKYIHNATAPVPKVQGNAAQVPQGMVVGRMQVPQAVDAANNSFGVTVTGAVPARNAMVGVSQEGGAVTMGATPEQSPYSLQYQFAAPGQQINVQYTIATANQPPPGGVPVQLSSTPTGYGYGSWGAVYPSGGGGGIPIAGDIGVLGTIRGTPPTPNVYSSSPGSIFPLGYFPPPSQHQQHQPTPQSPLASNNLVGALSQMSIGGVAHQQQQPLHSNNHASVNPSPYNYVLPSGGGVLGNGIPQSNANVTQAPPSVQQPTFLMMTPPNASAFPGFMPMPAMYYQPAPGTRPPFNGSGVPTIPATGHYAPSGARRSLPGQLHRGFVDVTRLESKGPVNQQHSQLLDDFRNSRLPQLQLLELGSQVVEFCTDQHGSRFIQQKLERANDNEREIVFNQIIPHARTLIADVFGNYVIQKFFEFGNTDQKRRLAAAIKGSVVTFALQMYGCRVVQKAIESVEPAQQLELLREMEGQVLKCVKDQNGNHVVQKVIERVEPTRLQFIIDALVYNETDSICSLSLHTYGCRVVQRMLEHCTEEQKRPVMEQLHQCLKTLIVDQYGNYVVQHMIEHGSSEDRDRIIGQICGDVLKYAQHKFASNAIEKCLICGSAHHKDILISEVCGDGGTDSPLLDMMKDPFANYVIQKMLDVADSGSRKKLMFAIKAHIPQLRKYNYGKHIITKLEKYFQKAANSGTFGQDADFMLDADWNGGAQRGQPSMF